MDGARIRLPVDVECREDLHEMQQVIKDGKYNYMAKRTAEGHSDRCTALALANRASLYRSAYIPPFVAGNRHNPETRRI
jgi:phage FluMu gp28-like protein